MESYQHSESRYFPHPNGFRHTCPECGKVFYGRKNKKFCCPECKTLANNRKAAARKSRVGLQVLALEKNAQIIFDYVIRQKCFKLAAISTVP